MTGSWRATEALRRLDAADLPWLFRANHSWTTARLGMVMLLLELQTGQLVKAAMRPHSVVVAAPALDHHLGLGARSKPLEAQALVAQLAAALVAPVLPGPARIDQGRGDAALLDPLQDGPADELRSVVRTQERRRAVHADQAAQYLDHSSGANRAGHVDSHALAGELVDHCQALDLLAAGRGGRRPWHRRQSRRPTGSSPWLPAAGRVGRWRYAFWAAGAATAARPGPTAGAHDARPARGRRGAGRCGCADSHTGDTGWTRSSSLRSLAHPWQAVELRSSDTSAAGRRARRRGARSGLVRKRTRPARAALTGSPFALISLSTEMSRSRSARRRFSSAFSASRDRRRLTSLGAQAHRSGCARRRWSAR